MERERQKEKWKWIGRSKRTEVKEGKRIREKGEDGTVLKRKCVNPVSVEAFDIFSQEEISESDSCGADSDCGSGTRSSALVRNDIHVRLSFAVKVLGNKKHSVSGSDLGRSVVLSLCRVCLWLLM